MISRQDMEQARRTADKYIAREEGDDPSTSSGLGKPERDEQYVQDVTTLLHFLIGWTPERIRNGYTAKEAFDAACRLLGFEPEIMRAHLTEDDL